MIEAAAIKTSDGKVWSVPRPGRHDACFVKIAAAVGYDVEHQKTTTEEEHERWIAYMRDHVQGFTTDQGVFLDRAQSYEHAKECGQLAVSVAGVLVSHAGHGLGRVIEADGDRVHVRFARHSELSRSAAGGTRLWLPRNELQTAILGSALTSEDVW